MGSKNSTNDDIESLARAPTSRSTTDEVFYLLERAHWSMALTSSDRLESRILHDSEGSCTIHWVVHRVVEATIPLALAPDLSEGIMPGPPPFGPYPQPGENLELADEDGTCATPLNTHLGPAQISDPALATPI
ncbi:hypothetical protein FRC08_016347 [Ceratobasidium sp. 394]|nr:hypothetical protein FRC08_016347 [Ceratobasidium sp. 394]